MNSFYYMPFGKFKGKSLDSIESGYLAWLVAQADIASKYPTLIEEARAVLARRNGKAPPQSSSAGDYITIRRDYFNQWYRKLTIEWHPDRRGGDSEPMRALNVARDQLLALALPGGAR